MNKNQISNHFILIGSGPLNSWKINTSLNNILGKGAYGIVYKAKDKDEETFAVKTIDGKLHPRILTQNVNKFLELSHPNIVKICDIHRNDSFLHVYDILSFW